MKAVATFPDLASAELAKPVLEAQEIPALSPDSNPAGTDWRLGTAIGGVRLQVDDQHLEEASEVLSMNANGAAEQSGISFAEAEKCPHCNSTHIGPDDPRRLKILSLVFFPIAFVTLPLILMALSGAASDAVAQGSGPVEPDLALTTASFPFYSSQVATLLVVPDGSGPSFAEARLVNGQAIDRRLSLWVLDGGGVPIGDILRTRWSLGWQDGGVVACQDGLAADHNTLANGTTEWFAPPYAGGHSQTRFQVRYAGSPLLSAGPWPMSLQVNSPDINGDLMVNLIDVAAFAGDYNGAYAFRSDLAFDGAVNLSDISVLAAKMGAHCP